MRWLLGLVAIWLVLCGWVALQPREVADPLETPWMEVRPTLSYDGSRLAFEYDPQAAGTFGRDPEARTSIALIDRKSNSVSKLSGPVMSFHSPRLSGAGDKLFFEAAPGPDYLSDVYLAETADLQKQTRIASPWRTGGHGSSYAPNLSASGEVIAFITHRLSGTSTRTWERAVAVGTPEKIETPFPSRLGIASSMIAISPDGRRLAWENRHLQPDGVYRDRLIVCQDLQQTRTLEEPAWEPSLSNDLCAYVTPDPQGVYQIVLYDFNSGEKRMLTSGSDDSFEPCLSADGKLLAFTSYAENLVANDTNHHSDVFLMEIDSGTITCLSLGGNGNSFNPTLSGDGTTVAFASLAGNLGSEPVEPGQIYVWEQGWERCEVVGFRK